MIADTNSQAVLNADTCKKLQQVKLIFNINTNLPAFLEKYQECFGEVGTFSTIHHITDDPLAPPVINHPRKIPFALKKLKGELDRMTKIGIIKPVSESSEWEIFENLNGSLCICLDPRKIKVK